MKAIIIDDERKARNVLRVLVEENCSKITEIYEASNLLDGVAIIREQEPNIVFLDIEMPNHSGLEILNFIERDIVSFEIIFTTAYSEYAIQAFQLSAIDYLLKPVRPNQVKEAVDRAIKVIGKSQLHDKLDALKARFTSKTFQKVGLPMGSSIKFVQFDQIILMKADGMYTHVHTKDNEKLLVTKPLKHFVALLESQATFYRPHRSFLINMSYIKEYIKSDGGYIVMDDDTPVSISRDKKDAFIAIISNS